MFRVLVAVSCCALTGYSALAEDRGPSSLTSNQPLMPAFRGLLHNLPGVSGAVSRLTGERPQDQPGLLEPLLEVSADEQPAELVQVRLSQAFLQDFLERDFNRESQVHETILGTSVGGTATTQGTTTLVLHSSPDKAVIEVVLKGTVESQTIGHHRPVQLHSTSHSPFESRKIIHLTAGGIEAFPATSTANTRSTTHQIRSTLPGMRGRIAQHIAERRVEESREEADAIASRNTERRLNAAFDKTVEQALAKARGAVHSKLASLPIGKLADDWRYRSEPEYVQMTLISPDAPQGWVLAAEFETEAAVAVRLHRNAVRGALTNADLRESLRPLLMRLMSDDNNDVTGAVAKKTAGAVAATPVSTVRTPEFRVAWSKDRKWLEFHFTPNEPAPADERAPTKLAITGR